MLIPIALSQVFLLLHRQFHRAVISLIIWSGVAVAGGFTLPWLHGQPWCLDFSVFGASMRGTCFEWTR